MVGVKHQMESVTEEINNFFQNPHLPDMTLANFMHSPGKITHEVSHVPLSVHQLAAVICLGFSATFHLFYVKSYKASSLLSRMDYAGISILIAGSTFPPHYYGFYCAENTRKFLI